MFKLVDQVVDLIAAGIESADHCAHAGAGNAVHGNVIFLEDAKHAEMRITARAAAGEHETYLGACRNGSGRGIGARRSGCEQDTKQKQDDRDDIRLVANAMSARGHAREFSKR